MGLPENMAFVAFPISEMTPRRIPTSICIYTHQYVSFKSNQTILFGQQRDRMWSHQQRHTNAIGRIVTCHPSEGERYYLRLLLTNIKRCFFIDGPGGGKTFLYRALLANVRSKGFIALATASSVFAASILPGGRAHIPRFKIPIDIDNNFTCNISKQSSLASLIRFKINCLG
ncbi:hypothetical protein H5410_059850 [Solanum commersonii]|uniref:ATP-dependent DNA helicase n=1 Tax=Solanum commersonii TaxID=4109 RepID=A0A9J5W483_SOLCO|nr:hypothetical protein H5410_059850 [Solanum commersonii]